MSNALFKRVETLDLLIEGIKRLKVRMSSMLDTVGDALSHTECPPLARIAEDVRHGIGVYEAWRGNCIQMMGKGKLFEYLNEDDIHILDVFFERLGYSGREEQEILLLSTVESLKEQRVSARKSASETGKLYATVGFLLGVMISIIVI